MSVAAALGSSPAQQLAAPVNQGALLLGWNGGVCRHGSHLPPLLRTFPQVLCQHGYAVNTRSPVMTGLTWSSRTLH